MTVPALRTVGLGKRFGRLEALADLDLEIAPGEVVGYLGPNGAGKTTTIRLVLGMLRPTAGRAEIFGLDAQRETIDAHRRIAYVPGEANLWPSLTGAETLHLLGRLHGRVDRVARDDLIERFQLDPSRKVHAYSKGNRQKVLLIAALMTRADLLIMDEPTAGLDPLMEQVFRDCVREARDRGQAILLSSHILSEVEAVSDRVGILRSGRLVDMGTFDELRHLSAFSVEATLADAVPEVASLPGVRDAHVEGHTLTCQVHGSFEPLMSALAPHGVLRLVSRVPSLEELFLAHYGANEPRPAELTRVR
jgi:ABC-2 type transport system ATP-binding protein